MIIESSREPAALIIAINTAPNRQPLVDLQFSKHACYLVSIKSQTANIPLFLESLVFLFLRHF